MLTHLFLGSSLSLSYFILAFLMRKCLGKHSCMSFSFPIVLLNDTSFFPTVQLQVHNENPAWYGRNTDALVNLNTKLNWLPSLISGGPPLSRLCLARVLQCLRLLVGLVDWCAIRLVRLICWHIIWTAVQGVCWSAIPLPSVFYSSHLFLQVERGQASLVRL